MKMKLLTTTLLILAFLSGMAQFAQAASSVTSLVPSADTYVDSSKPTTNFGSILTTWVRAGTPTRRALLRFNLSAIPAGSRITSAVLKLYVSSDGSAVAGNVNAVSGSWSETSVTYATAPALGPLIAGIPGPATALTSVSVNLTTYVSGKSTVNLYVVTPSTDGVVYYTREKGSTLAPRLIVTWTPPTTASPTLSLVPTSTRTAVPSATHSSTATAAPTLGPSTTPTKAPTPSVTASPTATSAPNGSLVLPLRLAFYYDSYPEAWGQGTTYPNTNWTPSLGFYDSSDLSLIRQHIASMQYARIQGGIASWSAIADATDNRFPGLLAAAAGSSFKWTLYYEPEARGNPSSTVIASDLGYVFNKYTRDPGYLHVAGKPVIFVNAGADDDCGMADRWKAANSLGFYVVLKVFSGYPNCGNQPDNWHQFGPSADYDVQGSHAVTISPGYWTKGQSAVLARNLTRWNQDIRNMLAARTDFQLISTWNGWAEGTQVESSVELGQAYVDALHDNGVLPQTVMAAGDIVCDTLLTTDITCQQMAVSQLLVDQKPNAVFPLGDLCHTTSVDCFYNYYDPSWGRLFSISHPITGNHEYGMIDARYYFDYWNGLGVPGGRAGERGKGYYSLDIGTWHVIALNSQCEYIGGCDVGSPEYTWLQQDLDAHTNQCTLVVSHKPLFGSTSLVSAVTRPLWQLLYAKNADVILNGHSHTYERFAPQDPNGVYDPLRGIREIIVGTGGAFHTGIGTLAANSQVRNAMTFGALKLTLHPDRYDWQFMPVPGQTFTDSGTTFCH